MCGHNGDNEIIENDEKALMANNGNNNVK